MSNIVIKAEDISKQYRLGQVGTGTLSHDLNRWWHQIRGKEDPYLKIGEANDRSKKGSSDYVWSLKDINFEIEQGDAVGIIGRNGAGKSTLLKLLSKVTKPTTGNIYTKGRIASLLEVGTGFHPEMTGRENIYLNGAILGMRRHEIKRKFDEIVDFAGIEAYIDTPVKRYSSGMYVRLAFAVAAHLESEILIIDEVLAVGDAEFQKKCLGKMGEVSKGEGRTVLFVSHNMAAIERLCPKSMYLKNGKLKNYGDTQNIVTEYIFGEEELQSIYHFDNKIINDIQLHSMWMEDQFSNISDKFNVVNDLYVCMKYTILEDKINIFHGISLYNESDIQIFANHDLTKLYRNKYREKKTYITKCKIPKNFLNEGIHSAAVALIDSKSFQPIIHPEERLMFKVYDNIEGNSARLNYTGGFPGIVRPILDWETN